MKNAYYLTRHGKLERRENTVYFFDDEGNRRAIPIEKVHTIYAYGKVSFTSGVVSLLAKHHVAIHFFNMYGFYEGSFYPREYLLSGDVLVKQVEHHLDSEKRLFLARAFVRGCGENMLKNLRYYERNERDLGRYIRRIENALESLEKQDTVPNVMQKEGEMWEAYYESFGEIFPEDWAFEKRSRRPPENEINALISFGNSLLYTTVLSEIYNTQLNPTVSFLHEPSERRYSLSLDISEIFKPVLVDRTIFKLVNKQMLTKDDFDKTLNSCLLKEDGKRKFLKEWESRLESTIKHRGLGRSVSQRRLIRLECYKLIKHFMGIKEYKPFVIWW